MTKIPDEEGLQLAKDLVIVLSNKAVEQKNLGRSSVSINLDDFAIALMLANVGVEYATKIVHNDVLDQNRYNEDLVNVKTSILCEVARELEGLRRENPMNGDASNLMLDECLKKVYRLDGSGLTIHAAADERAANKAKREADYLRLEQENELRRRNRHA